MQTRSQWRNPSSSVVEYSSVPWSCWLTVHSQSPGKECSNGLQHDGRKGYQSTRHSVISSHGHVVTRSTRHRSTRHTRVIRQSTRHKRAHNKTTSTSLHVVKRHPETVLNTDGVITAICVTLMYTVYYRSWRQITLLRKARSTRHNAVKRDGQLVTRFYDVTSWPCDELTGSLCSTISNQCDSEI